jgi:hypothetical protein
MPVDNHLSYQGRGTTVRDHIVFLTLKKSTEFKVWKEYVVFGK